MIPRRGNIRTMGKVRWSQTRCDISNSCYRTSRQQKFNKCFQYLVTSGKCSTTGWLKIGIWDLTFIVFLASSSGINVSVTS